MVTQTWFYDAILYIYALSLLFYFADFSNPNRSAKRMGTGLLLFVWVLQTIYLVYSLTSHLSLSAFSMFETLFIFGWLLVTVSLAMSRFFRIELFVFFVNVFGFAMLALNIFSKPGLAPTLSRWNVTDELLFIHITLAVTGYAAFVVSAVFSGMYLFLHRKLKEKKWTQRMQRLPSLEKMDHYALVSVVIGAPLLLLSLSLGIVWIALQGDYRLFFDPKVLNSWFVLLAYVFYMFQRLLLKAPGNRLAVWNLAAFAITLLNFVLTNYYSTFHQWS
ncbi:cytochrome c biogenesis protein CcsA [Paenibacillus validus]|uniref:Cytochrome C assembly protein n=1 Tax=Paenibacillus validus TaxID=44253 RepID=A0A7X3CRL3_9BACL|nr:MULTISPECIES: cytochrome c biogenesis protein CcsA [Paenibacillus]MED4601178.1 cytochrome c biogenesis protein CcsA [Paenibacillus validus]MED4605836.1 cytochrome c biogenesis protein CcsA [Paenibacillus validus]MUG69099.1 cytochrome C assembly protein [Paenibacillus validus]